jgi:hypothetical protein
MASRLTLHKELCTLLGSNNVYFQPPESIKLRFPCIIYTLDKGDARFADNRVYSYTHQYTITYIDSNPDHDMIDKMFTSFSMCVHDRRFISNNLYHDVFSLYY